MPSGAARLSNHDRLSSTSSSGVASLPAKDRGVAAPPPSEGPSGDDAEAAPGLDRCGEPG
eukprot:scaffold30926_cov62-Phaeocystis_antarctica.AAC.16